MKNERDVWALTSGRIGPLWGETEKIPTTRAVTLTARAHRANLIVRHREIPWAPRPEQQTRVIDETGFFTEVLHIDPTRREALCDVDVPRTYDWEDVRVILKW